MNYKKDEREWAQELAERLNTQIVVSHLLPFWSLPLLDALIDRVESLERRVKELEGA